MTSLESSWRPINDEADLTAASSRLDIFADDFPSSSSALLGVVGEVDISGDGEGVKKRSERVRVPRRVWLQLTATNFIQSLSSTVSVAMVSTNRLLKLLNQLMIYTVFSS